MKLERQAYHSPHTIPSMEIVKYKFNQHMALEIKVKMKQYRETKPIDTILTHSKVLCEKLQDGEYRFNKIFIWAKRQNHTDIFVPSPLKFAYLLVYFGNCHLRIGPQLIVFSPSFESNIFLAVIDTSVYMLQIINTSGKAYQIKNNIRMLFFRW